MKRGCAIATASAAFLLAAPGYAGAAVTIGSDLAPDPVNASICTGAASCTATDTQLPGQQLASPISGVVVRWRVRANNVEIGGPSLRLRVIRPSGVAAYTGINSSATQVFPNTGSLLTTLTFVFGTRQSIAAGDRLAVDVEPPSGNFRMLTSPQAGVTFARWQPPLGNGATSSPNFIVGNNNEATFNADIEPDADGDGFGDETQDACPGQKGDASGCDKTPPEGKITKGPKKRIKTTKPKLKVKFSFTSNEGGGSFQCKLDRKPFKGCKSPKRYLIKAANRLKKHTFQVRAIDAAGNVDPTPAKRSFKVRLID